MTLVDQAFINHHIQVHDRNGRTTVRLTDESRGPWEDVDDNRIIETLGSSFLIPLKSGGSTPASAEEVVYLLSKLKMAVTKIDPFTGEDPIVIDHFFLPESDQERLELLKANRTQVIDVERTLENGDRSEAPEWYQMLKSIRDNPGRSLF